MTCLNPYLPVLIFVFNKSLALGRTRCTVMCFEGMLHISLVWRLSGSKLEELAVVSCFTQMLCTRAQVHNRFNDQRRW